MKKVMIIVAALALIILTACSNMDVMPRPSQDLISEEKAKSIALQDAGLTEDQVTFTKVNVTTYQVVDDNDKPVTNANGDKQYSTEYEIEFTSGKKEYEYSIDALDGSIIDKYVDKVDDDD